MSSHVNHPRYILPVIVLSQFCCTSLWFAGNGIMPDLISTFELDNSVLGHLTSMVQLGFISGTLVFALLTIGDRFSPSRVFFFCAMAGALFNGCIMFQGNTLETLLSLRFLTGFFLAGIYPIGMKIAADYYDKGLGRSLGFLVGALVLGTAFPHLFKGISASLPWKSVLITTSLLAVAGGSLVVNLIPDGPFRKPGFRLDLTAFFRVFKNKMFRSAAFGYFGHMWELYAFWAFIPVILKTYHLLHPGVAFNIPLWSFIVIAVGGPACVIGSLISEKIGTKSTAAIALGLSGACCLTSPLFFIQNNEELFLAFLLFWGIMVIADSPLFSTLVANNALPEIKGTALTIVNCIGFSITILSIQLLNYLAEGEGYFIFVILALGPAVGLSFLISSHFTSELGKETSLRQE